MGMGLTGATLLKGRRVFEEEVLLTYWETLFLARGFINPSPTAPSEEHCAAQFLPKEQAQADQMTPPPHWP